MRIVVATVQTPFIAGGAQILAKGLMRALHEAGHEADLVTVPFSFTPESAIEHTMDFCSGLDASSFSGIGSDLMIGLMFPAYGINHHDTVTWMLHQHRSVYELYREDAADAPLRRLRTKVHDFDNRHLPRSRRIFTISRRVSERLETFNGIASTPLYHPPYGAEYFTTAPAEDYVFFPSRLEVLKRQSLFIEAMAKTKSGVKGIIAGTGGQYHELVRLIEKHGLTDRVRLVGSVTEAEKIAYYAHCLGVVFPPYDEDYGYITLEAMLSSKPVITCADSGGPLEFVVDRQTGFVVPPESDELASAIDRLAENPAKSAEMGAAGRARYDSLGISWQSVVAALTERS